MLHSRQSVLIQNPLVSYYMPCFFLSKYDTGYSLKTFKRVISFFPHKSLWTLSSGGHWWIRNCLTMFQNVNHFRCNSPLRVWLWIGFIIVNISSARWRCLSTCLCFCPDLDQTVDTSSTQRWFVMVREITLICAWVTHGSLSSARVDQQTKTVSTCHSVPRSHISEARAPTVIGTCDNRRHCRLRWNKKVAFVCFCAEHWESRAASSYRVLAVQICYTIAPSGGWYV